MRSCILALAALTVVGPALAAQERAQSDNRVAMQDVERGRRMLRQLRETLDKYYYDSTYGGFDLEASQRRTDSALGHAQTVPEIAGLLAQFLHDLDDSHTRFYPPGLSVTVDYGWRWRMIGERCYVISVREESDAVKKQLQVGDRVLAIDGIRLTRENASLVAYVYHTLSPRAGMRLQLERVDGTPAELVIESSIRRHSPITDYTDLENLRRAREAYERTSRIGHQTRSFDSRE